MGVAWRLRRSTGCRKPDFARVHILWELFGGIAGTARGGRIFVGGCTVGEVSGAAEESDIEEGGAGELSAGSAAEAGKSGEGAAAAGLGEGEGGGVDGVGSAAAAGEMGEIAAAAGLGEEDDTTGVRIGEIIERRVDGRGEEVSVDAVERLAKGKTCSTKVTWRDTWT